MVARYQPERLGISLPRSSVYAQLKKGKPRRLRQGRFAPGRLAPATRRLPVLRVLMLTVALTAAAMFGGTAARYLKEWSNPSLVTAGSFYFASKELDGSRKYIPAENGRVEFAFTLQNYIVEQYPTQYAIPYTCKVTDSADTAGTAIANVEWNKRHSGTEALSGTLGSLNTGDGKFHPATVAYICSIPVDAFGSDGSKTLVITAAATAPYTAELTVRVKLATENGGVELTVTDPRDKTSGAVAVTLYNTGGKDARGTLTWPAENLELAPDPTWETVTGGPWNWAVKGEQKSAELTVPAGQAVSVVFLVKDTESSYTEADFKFAVTQYIEPAT